jgi:hypothetical protein
MDESLNITLENYQSESARGKTLTFAKGFLKYLTKTRLDSRYYAFEIFLDRPKHLKVRKNVTSRIITKEDIENILTTCHCIQNWLECLNLLLLTELMMS